VNLYYNQFNLCKSHIAWLEATFAGAVTIAPNWPEFNRLGVVRYNDEAEFETSVNYVMGMTEEEHRERVSDSCKEIEMMYTLKSTNQQRHILLTNLINK
jgi:hypothetical protein